MSELNIYSPGLFYGGYLWCITKRLDNSFRGSYLALSKWTVYALKIGAFTITMLDIVPMSIDIHMEPCGLVWNPPDLDRSITFCHLPAISLVAFKYYIVYLAVAMTNMLNITLSVIFSVKLSKLVKMGKSASNQSKQLELQALIAKQSILTVVGCISTTIAYALYSLLTMGVMLHLDFLINGMVIGLLFRWNDGLYSCLCRPCIILCPCSSVSSESSHMIEMAKLEQGKERVLNISPVASEAPFTPSVGASEDDDLEF